MDLEPKPAARAASTWSAKWFFAVAILSGAAMFGIADGPTEVHLASVAKALTRGVEPHPGFFPSDHLPSRRTAARAKLAAALSSIPGVVEHGLFIGMASLAIISGERGVETLER